MEGDIPVIEATTAEEVPESEIAYDESEMTPVTAKPEVTPTAPVSKPAAAKPETVVTTLPADSDLDLVIACPDCGKVINVDMFEYPVDVYSKMGEARLKQARFFVVQGKPDEAMKAVRKARSLYEKADDKKGLKEVLKLVESLAKVG
jgi:transcription elongation factor Elf1